VDISNENNHEKTFWEHSICLNDKTYTAYKENMDSNAWSIAMVNFSNILN